MLELGAHTDYHLVLAHLIGTDDMFVEDSIYDKFYREVQGFKILDNGAAEGELVGDAGYLHQLARYIQADEIVVPDVIGDAHETAVSVLQFGHFVQPDDFGYMAVLQGQNMSEIQRMLDLYESEEWITTIALPRVLLKTFGDDIRVNLARIIQGETRFKKENIHCLGAGSWMREIQMLTRLDLVRGMDTSLPINYGLASVALPDEGVEQPEQIVKRPSNYFGANVARNTDVWQIIKHNVDTYLSWAGYAD
jgi:hypothetical protein